MEGKPGIRSVRELLDAISAARDGWSAPKAKEVWFRGASSVSHELLPSAYRKSVLATPYADDSALFHFRSIAHGYMDREPADLWEWYFLMQHYGLHTRLLDWTELPLVATFFAIDALRKDAEVHAGCERAPSSLGGPCVWMLDAEELNRLTWPDDGSIICPREVDERPTPWLPGHCRHGGSSTAGNQNPIAIYPTRRNPRIVAQAGTFTVHGCAATPLESIMKTSPRLVRLDIDRDAALSTLAKELSELGFIEHRVFPELDRVARYVRDWESS